MPDEVDRKPDTAIKPEDPDKDCGCADEVQTATFDGYSTADGGYAFEEGPASQKRRAVHPKVGAIALVNGIISTAVGILAWKHVSTPPDAVIVNVTLVLDGIVGYLVPSDLW